MHRAPMHVFRGTPTPQSRTPCCLGIGNFDGVHRGHQVVLEHLVASARRLKVDAAVMTFEPHPREYFAGVSGNHDLAPARIASLRDKLDALERFGIDRVIVEHFNARLAAMAPEAFVDDILVAGCNVQSVCVGEDFRFGAKRRGDIALLERLGRERGFEVETIAPVLDTDGQRISSSAVRAALAAADFETARRLLGRPYTISGHVTHGRKLGRTLGYPTLNLRLEHGRPATTGVFVVRVEGVDSRPIDGIASLGVRPTVTTEREVMLEPHLLDWSGDAYGRVVRVEFLHKLREELKFDDLDTLIVAMRKDEADTRAWLSQHASP
ncbi:bifunctional riboflavin kinase/FAD synthetase [soil metagenome]